MNFSSTTIENFQLPQFSLKQIIGGAFLILFLQIVFYAQTTNVSTTEDQQTLIVEDAKESEVLAFGKNVIIKQHAKGVFAFGGDVIVEGKVDEDVATIGGSIVLKEGASIGGDVIVLGGTYRAESKNPLRNPEKETVIIGVFEQEFRDFAQNPSQIFSPTLTWGFLIQRILSILFWFVLSFALTTISPGAVSRAVARFQLSTTKIIAIGMLGFLISTVGIIASVGFLPGYLGGIVGLMTLLLLLLTYIFGRVAMQVSLGKFLQKQLIPEKSHSETLAILIGVVAWTIILSIPYLWTLALILLFSASIGLVFTARAKNGWQKA